MLSIDPALMTESYLPSMSDDHRQIFTNVRRSRSTGNSSQVSRLPNTARSKLIPAVNQEKRSAFNA